MKATLVIALCLASAFPLGASVIYDMALCGGSYAPCPTTGTHRMPAPGQTTGLDDVVFFNYFSVNLPSISPPLDPGGSYSWTVVASTAGGTVIGRVDGPSSIHTSYVFQSGAVLCCTDDDPFRLTDINEDGLMVGVDPQSSDGGSLFAPVLNRVRSPARIPIDIVNGSLTPFASFDGIDDSNRIFGRQFGQDFVLTPVPEAGAAVMLLAGLGIFSTLEARKRRLHAFRKWS